MRKQDLRDLGFQQQQQQQQQEPEQKEGRQQ
jgi:hypothetical protein